MYLFCAKSWGHRDRSAGPTISGVYEWSRTQSLCCPLLCVPSQHAFDIFQRFPDTLLGQPGVTHTGSWQGAQSSAKPPSDCSPTCREMATPLPPTPRRQAHTILCSPAMSHMPCWVLDAQRCTGHHASSQGAHGQKCGWEAVRGGG